MTDHSARASQPNLVAAAPRRGSRLPRPDRRWALFLDVDGTLLDIAARPELAVSPTGLREALAGAMAALDGALALNSGRLIADIDRIFSPFAPPAAGLHGLERRNDSTVIRAMNSVPALDAARTAFAAFAARHPGVMVEDKELTLALHYRGAPQAEAEARALVEGLCAADARRLDLIEGKMMVEVKPPGSDKGTAIEAFLAEAPFRGRRPVFAGDDVTDEAGFATVNRLGGLSIRVGPLPPGLTATAARWQCGGVGELVEWLAELPRRLG